MNRVALFGASGFVGTAVLDHLAPMDEWDVLPIIHSSGNAWELGRRGMTLHSANLMKPAEIDRALDGCTHVVNCSRGPDDVMITGLGNLVKACRKAGIQRLVHLSSVAVYGDPPLPEAHSERAAPKLDNSYAEVKLEQDRIVEKAAAHGLSSAILCPPNISGAGSDFMVDAVQALADGTFAFVEGDWPVNVVDVRNLAASVGYALAAPTVEAERLFVTDGESVSWERFIRAILDMSGVSFDTIPTRSEADARKTVPSHKARPKSLVGSVKHLFSGEVRSALREDPLLSSVDAGFRGLVPMKYEEKIRWWLNGPTRVSEIRDDDGIDTSWFRLQLRGVEHSCARAMESIGYRPVLSFDESVESFRQWFHRYHGWNTDTWSLARELR